MYSLEVRAAKYRNLTITINKELPEEWYSYNFETQEAQIFARNRRSAHRALSLMEERTRDGGEWLLQ